MPAGSEGTFEKAEEARRAELERLRKELEGMTEEQKKKTSEELDRNTGFSTDREEDNKQAERDSQYYGDRH